MMNMIKKLFFSLYLYLTRYENLLVKKFTYKFGDFVIRPLGRATYKINDSKYRLSPLNMIDKSIIATKHHDIEVENVLKTSLSGGGIFIDIGANWGYFSILASRMKNVQVISFEPSRKELTLLYEHCAINNVQNAIIFPIGLSDSSCVQKLFYGPSRNTGTNSVVINNNQGGADTIFCELDHVIPVEYYSQIRLIKIDVEGYEVSVLKGMQNLLRGVQNCKAVVEVTPQFLEHAGAKPQDIYDLLYNAGFESKYGLQVHSQYDEVFIKTQT